MASAQDLRRLVKNYVSGDVSASDFANRFTPIFQGALQSRDKCVKELALDIHAQMSHHFNGFISEAEFRKNLQPVADAANQVIGTFSFQVTKTIDVEPLPSNPGHNVVVAPELEFARLAH